MKLFITLYLFLFALLSSSFASAQPDDLLITSISGIKPWSAQMTQEVKIEISLPKGFHAYNDQFKILKLNPDSYSIGGLHTSPETEFFDKYTQKTRKGLFEKGTLSLIVEAAEKNVDPQQQIDFDLRYQICSESVCHLPQTLPIQLKVNSSLTQAGAEVTAPLTKTFSLIESIDSLLRTNLWLAFIVIFFAGVLTSFTPCIFPMLPITISILGYHADKNSRFKNFSRSLAYVLGIALTYSSLGVAAALTGSLFGSMLTNKYVLGALVILFFAMAFSM
ncbi:MAG: cytochrome c biogenesis protein CcdA, partial [Pseudobdellovibrio sp.]